MTRATAIAAILGVLGMGCGPEPAAHGRAPRRAGKADTTDLACPAPSALFSAVRTAVTPVLDHGTLSPKLADTCRNRAEDTVFIDPEAIYTEYARLIRLARHEVDLQTFTLSTTSDPTKTVLAALKQLEADLAAEGPRAHPVMLRLLVNTSTVKLFAGGVNRDELMRSLAAALNDLELDPDLVRYQIATHAHVTTGSLHSKMLIVDGQTAVLTGANMGPFYDYDWGEHDAAFVVEGEVARSLLADFDDAWSRSDRWNTQFCGAPLPWPLEPIPEGDCLHANEHPPVHHLPDLNLPDTCTPMLVAGRPWKGGLHDEDHDNPQDQAFLAALGAAQQLIRIRTPNLNVQAVEEAIIDGILTRPQLVVQIVLAKGYEDLAEQFDGGTNVETVAELYGRLTAAGVAQPCDRLQIRWYSHLGDGVTPVVGKVDKDTGVNHPSHVKYTSIDGQIAIVGSANMDNQSWSRSREVNVVIDDPALVQAWDQQLFGQEFTGAVPVDECQVP